MHARTVTEARHATSPGNARALTPSAARCAVAIARRNYEHAKDAVARAETARRLAAAELARVTAEAAQAGAL